MIIAKGEVPDNRKYMLKGYLSILVDAVPNGRFVHCIKQKQMVLQWVLQNDWDINEECELEIKSLIRKIYHLHS